MIAERASDDQAAFHGLARALANNAVVGVTEALQRKWISSASVTRLTFRARRSFSLSDIRIRSNIALPEGIEAKAERVNTKTSINQYQTTITLSGIDKQKLGQVAAELNRLRKPDAYKGKGVRYADKFYRLKPGKTGK